MKDLFEPIIIPGDGKWLEEVFPGTKWKPIVMPTFSQEELKKHGPIDLTKSAEIGKFKFATPKFKPE